MHQKSFRSYEELEAGLVSIRFAPRDGGRVKMIVRRPTTNEREVLDVADLHPDSGLVGDRWRISGDGSDRDSQRTIMNARAIRLIAGDRENWPIAGDQLYVDMDLSIDHLPQGTQLRLGSAMVVISAPPHLGCRKFTMRYGADATRFVNSPVGKQLRLRGVNCRVVQAGQVRTGDEVKLELM